MLNCHVTINTSNTYKLILYCEYCISHTHLWLSELEPIVLAPLLHHLHEVLHLRIIRVLQHLDHLNQSLLGFVTSNHHLEDSNSSSTLAFPEFRIWVQSLQHIKCFD